MVSIKNKTSFDQHDKIVHVMDRLWRDTGTRQQL